MSKHKQHEEAPVEAVEAEPVAAKAPKGHSACCEDIAAQIEAAARLIHGDMTEQARDSLFGTLNALAKRLQHFGAHPNG